MIRLEQINKTFFKKNRQIHALKDVTLTIEQGEIYGIIGYSGSGKSTLVRTMNMLERPSSGKVIINNQEIEKLSDRELIPIRRKIGMIFQHFNLLSSATVFENIAFPLQLTGMDKKQIEEKTKRLLQLIDLEEKHEDYPSSLSGGQKQRVAIARALASEPEILLCDEATSALDPQTTRSILSLLKRINRELKITIVLITHQMEVIRAITDQVAVISDGKIVEQGTTSALFNTPKSPVTKELLNPSLIID